MLWYGQVFASLGTWMDQVTRGWLIYELTDSALQLGMVRGIQAIPFLLLSPIAGSTADRYSRKFQVVGAQFASGFLFAVTAVLIFTGLIRPWHVYVTAFLMACVQVFLQPSQRRDDFRFGAGEESHQRHRPQRRRLQYGAQHRPGACRLLISPFRHRVCRLQCKRIFHFGDGVDDCK